MTLFPKAIKIPAMKDKLSNTLQKKPPMTRVDLKTVRGMCLIRGTTLTHWLRDQGYSTDTAFNALQGRRHGPVSIKIREAVFSEFGV